MDQVKLGIVGCGNISDAYLKGAARSKLVAVKAVADLVPEAAAKRAEEYGVAAVPVEDMLADPVRELTRITSLIHPVRQDRIEAATYLAAVGIALVLVQRNQETKMGVEAPAPVASDAADATSIVMPTLGESVTEGTVTRWLKKVGDSVEVDEPLVEVSTDKVDTEIPSPIAGVLLSIFMLHQPWWVGVILAVTIVAED